MSNSELENLYQNAQKRYETDHIISQNLRDEKLPSYNDKKKLYQEIATLDKENHLTIFSNIIHPNTDKYTITNNSVLFDLDDLSPKTFWKLYLYVQNTIENNDRINRDNELYKIVLEDIKRDENRKTPILDQKDGSVTSAMYQALVKDALSRCDYSDQYNGYIDTSDVKFPGDRDQYQNIYNNTRTIKIQNYDDNNDDTSTQIE